MSIENKKGQKKKKKNNNNCYTKLLNNWASAFVYCQRTHTEKYECSLK
jgi:hypothetical protein